jgi:hypothetical protein
MKRLVKNLPRISSERRVSVLGIVSTIALLTGLIVQAVPAHNAYAAQITDRSLTLQPGTTDGGSQPGGVVNHLISFTVPTTAIIGSIKFEYCTLASGACALPTGVVTTAATMGSESGATGFTLDNTVNGAPVVTRVAPASVTGPTPVAYQLLSVTNPTTTNQTFFVRISTYPTSDASGPSTDAGTVTSSTATQIVLDGTMPESLVFCAGATVGTNVALVPDCATATSGVISFDQLFSPTDTATATSQMAASTNAGFGYVISVNGPTLTSGSNTVSAMGASAVGVHGVSQFGLNLKANTTATSTIPRGIEVTPSSNSTNYRGLAFNGYGAVDNFKFVTADPVANSAAGGTAGGTDAQIFTATYMVNVPGSQPAGTYTTTLTYICTPTF